MGILDTVLAPALGLIGGIPIVGAPVAGIVGGVVGTGAPGPTGEVGFPAPAPGGGGLLGNLFEGAQQIVQAPLDVLGQVVGGGAVDMTGFGGGNGTFATRTVVETMNLLTGQIVRRKVMEGSPHIMNKDVAAAKKVFRQTRKLDARMPRKTVRESKTKQLTDAAIQKAIRDVNKDCPPAGH